MEDGDSTVIHNHCYLRRFFASEARFTAQFEQLYHILEEHGRGDNPIATAKIYRSPREYHRLLQKPLEEDSDTHSVRLNRKHTNAEVAEMFKEAIVYLLHAERMWPDREFRPEDEAIAIRYRIVNEIQGMDEVPRPKFAIALDYMDEREAGDTPLMINGRWQASYDEWSRRIHETQIEKWRNFQMYAGEGNVLMANGKPLVYDEREHVASITTPDGYRVPLNLDDNGNMIIPSPSQIEEMKANGEGEWAEHPERPVTPPHLIKEEWKMQEAWRIIQEASREDGDRDE